MFRDFDITIACVALAFRNLPKCDRVRERSEVLAKATVCENAAK